MPLFSSSFSISEEQLDSLTRNMQMDVTKLKYSTKLKWKFEEHFAIPTAVTLSNRGNSFITLENYPCL
jgi:hypothetical protein